MLERLIEEICHGGSFETRTLAARLGTSPRLIEAMLEHLQRSGLIQDYIQCTDGCRGCGLRDSCGDKGALRLWQGKTGS